MKDKILKEAIDWYEKVKDEYPDAQESISYFEEKRIALDEVNIFRPKSNVEVLLKYRNIKETALQVYRVDLMKLGQIKQMYQNRHSFLR